MKSISSILGSVLKESEELNLTTIQMVYSGMKHEPREKKLNWLYQMLFKANGETFFNDALVQWLEVTIEELGGSVNEVYGKFGDYDTLKESVSLESKNQDHGFFGTVRDSDSFRSILAAMLFDQFANALIHIEADEAVYLLDSAWGRHFADVLSYCDSMEGLRAKAVLHLKSTRVQTEVKKQLQYFRKVKAEGGDPYFS